MASLETGPVANNGYYDVPICNQFSNKEIRDKPSILNQYNLNRDIGLTMNDNMGNYKVYNDVTVPSGSLSYETDYPQSGYYYSNKQNPMNLAYDGSDPIVKRKDSKVYNYISNDLLNQFNIDTQLNIESFENNNNKAKIMNLIILFISFIIIFLILCYI
jgi:hypothetical protein